MDTKMLRLCLTLSVLLGLQITATGADQAVIDFCQQIICHQPTQIIQHNNYEEMEFPSLQWVETDVSGTDMKTALKTGLEKLFKYSNLSNAAETIVPVSAPWGIKASLLNDTIQREFQVYLYLPFSVHSPPEPKDPTVQIMTFNSALSSYVRTFQHDNQEYGSRVREFMKDLNQDNRPFYRKFFYIGWFNTKTIVPVSAPWGIKVSLLNDKIQREFQVYLYLSPLVRSPPEPKDPTVLISTSPPINLYIRTFRHDNQDLGSRIKEFIKDLDQDNRPFYRDFFYIGWYNTRGLMRIATLKK